MSGQRGLPSLPSVRALLSNLLPQVSAEALTGSIRYIKDHLSKLALIDTHIFKLNEYFVELNPANFKVLNRILN